MVGKLLLMLATLALLLLPQDVFAHGPGQLPFLLINGHYAGFFPVPYSPSTKLEIPQDSAPQTYAVGQPIELELDQSRIGLSPYALKHTLFDWEFGDGASSSGLKVSHQFTRGGSYLVKVFTSTDANPGARQLAESVMLQVLPDTTKLPDLNFTINGQKIKASASGIVTLKFGQSMQFEAKTSGGTGTGSPQMTWDFGDGRIYTGSKVQHTFPATQNKALVVVRATNLDGIWVESGAQLQNQLLAQQTALNKLGSSSTTTASKRSPSQLKYVVAALAAGLVIVVSIRLWRRKRLPSIKTELPSKN